MKYLVIGNKGQLGKEFCRELERLDFDYFAEDFDTLNIAERDKVKEYLTNLKPDIIINCAAYNNVDLAESDYHDAFKTNSLGPKNLAEISKKINAFLVHFGTDYVFDGEKTKGLYTEIDLPNPLSMYGKSKYIGELFVSEEVNDFLVFRLSWLFGEGTQNFIYKFHQWTKAWDSLKVSTNEVSIPTWTKTVVQITLSAIGNGLTGRYHLTSTNYASRYEWAKFIAKELNIKKIINPVSIESFNLPAKRPLFSAMSNEKISNLLDITIPDWEWEVKKFLKNDFLNL